MPGDAAQKADRANRFIQVDEVGGYVSDYKAKTFSSHNTSPTTMSKTLMTRGAPTETHNSNKALHRRRLQSAYNRNSKKGAQAYYWDPTSALIPYSQRQELVGKSRRTQSAVAFKSSTANSSSLSKLERELSTTQCFSNIVSSNPHLRILKPAESVAAISGNKMSPDEVIALLTEQIEKQIQSNPDALNSETERKNLLN